MVLKRIFWKAIEKTLSHNNFKDIFWHEFQKIPDPSSNTLLRTVAHKGMESYPELKTTNTKTTPDPIFITARFRSGSTLLWNIFRQVDGLHSYYEPLNERMWFDKRHRKSHTDKSHVGITDYSSEYNNVVNVKHLFSKKWTNKHLLMDQTSFNPNLYLYIESLIRQAPERPVLQFNRVDFRLQWLKANFGNSKIIHLYRHPRDQWVSVTKYSAPVSRKLTGHDFSSYNLFYTIEWARDLTSAFPFLDPSLGEHPYYYHYLLWRLSYIYGKAYSDVSISFEDLVTQIRPTLDEIFKCVNIKYVDTAYLESLIVNQKLGKWNEYADDGWYRTIEEKCEDILNRFFY